MPFFKFNVNNEEYEVDVDADMPLLWVIRDFLKLKGTKYGCGVADCGACTVHFDGYAVRSCIIPISAIGKSKVLTIEGLSDNGDHPLQKAWIEEDVPQCGYCQSGQIMSAAALLKTNKAPSDADIDIALRGNICRCGTYVRIKKAIKKSIR